MPTGDGQHSFGHSSHCHWCGLDGDDPEIEKPCDERETSKPSEEAMAKYRARRDLGEQIEDIASDFGMGLITFDHMMTAIDKLRPEVPSDE